MVAYKCKQDRTFEKYGDKLCALRYQTEVRTRGEHFVRVKRQALTGYNKAWDETLLNAGGNG